MSVIEKHNYLNKEIKSLINKNIYEYDMKSAGYNILKSKNVFSNKEILYLENCPKDARNIYIGKKFLKSKKFNEILMNEFINIRKEFIEVNNIDEKYILSIKKDAIFVIDKKARKLKLSDNYEFVEKNKYSSYYYFNRIEFYYNARSNLIDLKGLNDDIKESNQFLIDLKYLFNIIETNNKNFINRKLIRYRDDYLNKRLDIEKYRELNEENSFSLIYESKILSDILIDNETDIDKINILYNYQNYLLPLIKESIIL